MLTFINKKTIPYNFFLLQLFIIKSNLGNTNTYLHFSILPLWQKNSN